MKGAFIKMDYVLALFARHLPVEFDTENLWGPYIIHKGIQIIQGINPKIGITFKAYVPDHNLRNLY